VVDPVVRAVLRSPAHRLLSGGVLELRYTGRRSGRGYALPVVYATAGDDLVVLVGQHESKTWWRNFGPDPRPVSIRLRGTEVPCTARRPDVGTADHVRAAHAYAERFPRVPTDPAAPLLLLTPRGRAGETGPH
jgi:hypothetical protein